MYSNAGCSAERICTRLLVFAAAKELQQDQEPGAILPCTASCIAAVPWHEPDLVAARSHGRPPHLHCARQQLLCLPVSWHLCQQTHHHLCNIVPRAPVCRNDCVLPQGGLYCPIAVQYIQYELYRRLSIGPTPGVQSSGTQGLQLQLLVAVLQR